MHHDSPGSRFNFVALGLLVIPLILIARLESGVDRPLTQTQAVLSCLAHISTLITASQKSNSADR